MPIFLRGKLTYSVSKKIPYFIKLPFFIYSIFYPGSKTQKPANKNIFSRVPETNYHDIKNESPRRKQRGIMMDSHSLLHRKRRGIGPEEIKDTSSKICLKNITEY